MKSKYLLIVIFVASAGCTHTMSSVSTEQKNVVLNDIHSQLNETNYIALVTPKSIEQIQTTILEAKKLRSKLALVVASIQWADNNLESAQ